MHDQYFTSTLVSNLLVEQFTIPVANDVLELGSGAGSLLAAVRRRWSSARLTSVDIDERLRETTTPLRPHRHVVSDVLSPGFPKPLHISPSSFDAAVCNPPYRNTAWNPGFRRLLKDAGLANSSHRKQDIAADLIFLAHNLRFLKAGGQLAIIVPDGTITGAKNRALRESLLGAHRIHSVIELPERSFSGTEAKTFILTLEKSSHSHRHIPLYRADHYGQLSEPILIDSAAAAIRMDYRYFSWLENSQSENRKSLDSIGCVQLFRGQISATTARHQDFRILHSTDMSRRTALGRIHIPPAWAPSTEDLLQPHARPGDIIVTRVGRKLSDKIARVASGIALISDCLYVIRGPRRITDRIWMELTSSYGKEWLNAHSRGVCAKVLNKSDLLAFPLPADIDLCQN
ncbi:N-6 DNA methylase [Corallococcus exercitus]|uniref:N-6 DNA methylase n=1 Tax=Corallococcus exercitus TaxID=2316736 RepID=UPI0035D51B31